MRVAPGEGHKMHNIDWSLVQLQYEIFGASFDDLANEYDTTPNMIKYAAEQRGWKIMPVAKACRDWTGIEELENVSDEILDEVNKRMKIMRTIKSTALGPRYIALEAAILGKSLELMQNLTSEDPAASSKLKTVSEILKTLREQNGTIASSQQANDSNQTKVLIMNKVGGDPALSDGPQNTQVVISGGHAVAPCKPVSDS